MNSKITSTYHHIPKSKINAEMSHLITEQLIYDCWSLILKEVTYAPTAINLIESKHIYDKDKLLIDQNSPLIKPDHTASRGFISNKLSSSFDIINPTKLSYDDIHTMFHPLTGTCLSAIILQMLGATFSSEIYNFPIYHAKGSNLFFQNSQDININKTKHFVSNQNIDALPSEIKQHLIADFQDYNLPINANDWENLKKIYAGENLSKNDLTSLIKDLPKKILARSWKLSSKTAKLIYQASLKNKALEYTYSTYLRGSWINHGTWRISDIFRGYGILQHLGTNPVPIKGLGTILEQTAGMAKTINYTTNDNNIITGPGAFLEIASRPYILHPQNDKQPILLKELTIELDSRTWKKDKIFLDAENNSYTLQELNSGILGKNTKLTSKTGIALCYEGFKESNAKGIFFAAGGNLNKQN